MIEVIQTIVSLLLLFFIAIAIITIKKLKKVEKIRDPFDSFPMITQIRCEKCGDPPFIRKSQRFEYVGQVIDCPKCKSKTQIEGIYTLEPFSKVDEKTRKLYEKWQ